MRISALPSLLSCAAALLAAGCADDVPGTTPPADELHFPFGMTVVPGTTADRDVLVVGNTNFDQRFNAGSLTSLSIDRLIAALPAPGAEAPSLIPDFPEGAIVDRVRIYQFSGDLVAVKLAEPASYAVFTPSRGRNRLTMAYAVDGRLECATDGRGTVPALDCSEGFIVRTEGPDPLSIAYSEREELLAIGHLRPELSDSDVIVNAISTIRPADFVARVALEAAGQDLEQDAADPVESEDVELLGGVTGLVFAPGAEGSEPRLLAAGRRSPTDGIAVSVSSFRLAGDPLLQRVASLELDDEALVTDLRGIAAVPESGGRPARTYASVRFFGVGDTSGSGTSAGLAVISADGDSLRLRSILEIGEELGRPYVLETAARRLVYLPDARGDLIHVLDASTDVLLPVATISGRFEREVDGERFLAHVLDAPSSIVFVERGGRRLGFVTNFSNSTLAVLDVSSEDPSEHRVVARFGRAVSPSTNEEERGQ